jgi:hypothetical protein
MKAIILNIILGPPLGLLIDTGINLTAVLLRAKQIRPLVETGPHPVGIV